MASRPGVPAIRLADQVWVCTRACQAGETAGLSQSLFRYQERPRSACLRALLHSRLFIADSPDPITENTLPFNPGAMSGGGQAGDRLEVNHGELWQCLFG